MLVYFDKNRKITSYAENTRAEAELIMQRNPYCAWHEGKFSFFMGEDKPGFEKAFYMEEDGTIRLEYEPIPPRQPTAEETMQARLDYLAMMTG